VADAGHEFEALVSADVARALAEDIGGGDLTAQLVPAGAGGHATVLTREPMVLAGTRWFTRSFTELDPDCDIHWHAQEGDHVPADTVLCDIHGRARAMLSAERSALNFLQLLSAVATRVRIFVGAVAGTGATIVDTRKTLPGLRLAQKYAVRVGGGHNHRLGLYDGILIKENHILAAGGIRPVLREAMRHAGPGVMVEIEVETLEQLREALEAGAPMVLLDNFDLQRMRDAVALTRELRPATQLEASGGVSLQSVRAIAETGVDRISIGALTKDVDAVDLSMRFRVKT
jgi:nicotinate-nucleotide pyrophosphorylase (carboxylating)